MTSDQEPQRILDSCTDDELRAYVRNLFGRSDPEPEAPDDGQHTAEAIDLLRRLGGHTPPPAPDWRRGVTLTGHADPDGTPGDTWIRELTARLFNPDTTTE